jgi:3-hydroxyisobutyrate dehydrogenase
MGSVGPAREGTLRVLVGAADVDAADAEPLLRLLGTVHRTGPVGSASALKVVGNLALALATASLGEALRLAHDEGIDRDTALETLAGGPLGTIAGYKREMLAAGTFQPAAFTLRALGKDVGLARDSARSDLPLTDAVAGRIHLLAEAGHGEEDFAVLAAYPPARGPEPSLFDD